MTDASSLATAPRLYSLTDVARELGSYRARVRDVARRCGVVPAVVAGSHLYSEGQLTAIRADHLARPASRRGPGPKARPASQG